MNTKGRVQGEVDILSIGMWVRSNGAFTVEKTQTLDHVTQV